MVVAAQSLKALPVEMPPVAVALRGAVDSAALTLYHASPWAARSVDAIAALQEASPGECMTAWHETWRGFVFRVCPDYNRAIRQEPDWLARANLPEGGHGEPRLPCGGDCRRHTLAAQAVHGGAWVATVDWVPRRPDVQGVGADAEEDAMKVRPEIFVALGLVLGGLVGVLTDNIAVWVGAGLAIGAGMAAAAKRRQG